MYMQSVHFMLSIIRASVVKPLTRSRVDSEFFRCGVTCRHPEYRTGISIRNAQHPSIGAAHREKAWLLSVFHIILYRPSRHGSLSA